MKWGFLILGIAQVAIGFATHDTFFDAVGGAFIGIFICMQREKI